MENIIKRGASAGSLESNDALVSIFPGDGGVNIEIRSIVEKQFGKQIRECAADILNSYGIGNVNLHIQDMGAVECTLRARVETALLRALKEDEK